MTEPIPRGGSWWLTVDSRTQWLPILPYQSASIIVESDHHSILSLHLLLRSDNDSMSYIAALDFILSCCSSGASQCFPEAACFLDDDYDLVTLIIISTNIQ